MEKAVLNVTAEQHLHLIKLCLMKDEVAQIFTPDEAEELLPAMLAKQFAIVKSASNFTDQYGTYGDYEVVDMAYTHGRLYACMSMVDNDNWGEEIEIVIG